MSPSCLICGSVLTGRASTSRYCLFTCSQKANASGGAGRARGAVARAVAKGLLPPAKTLTCVDCGSQARDYDHRDYNKPLTVEPVCRRCNKLRGPALQVEALRLPRARVDAQLGASMRCVGGCNA